ncbi:MAG: carboxypeptidase regulatory-like domain-containing protein [Pyrinomonadaceae bacterium]
MRKEVRFISLILSVIFCLSVSAFGQAETAQITGTVLDPTNAVVPGATVTATLTKTGFSRTATTNQDGNYVISNLPPGTYNISVKSGNFQEFKVTRELAVGAASEINATLSATAGPATVNVVAGQTDIGEVNTTDQTVSDVVSNRQLISLPTVTRNPYDFIRTLGNVSEGDNGGRGVGVTINGQRSASTSILINGGENVDTFTAVPGQSIPLDSVQEYRVVTGTFTADLGRATGGVVNLVTKSGQNRFFGSAYEYNRNSRFASAGFDANAKTTAQVIASGVKARPNFNRNQYGFSVGGPIIKNKLFFFTNTEWTKIRSTGNLRALVPSAASIAAAAPATQAFFANYKLAATPTGVTQNITATSGRVLTFNQVTYAVPSDTGAGTPTNALQSANRIDWNPTSKLQIYGVYLLDKNDDFVGTNGNSPYAGFSTGNRNYNQNIQGNATYALTSNFISTTRFTYNRLFNEQPLGTQPAGPTLYLKSSGNSIAGTRIAFPGYLPFNPGSAIPFGGPQKVYNLSQEFNYVYRNNILKFGGQYYNIHDDRTFGAFENSVETLGNSNATGAENFFNGGLLTFQTAINPQGKFPGQAVTLPVSFPQFFRNNRYKEYSVFGEDSFKLFPNFTVNAGLRYEYYGPQQNVNPNLDSNFYFGGDGTFSPAGVRSGSVQVAPNSPVGKLWKQDKNNFAPSVGFAYDIFGDGKTSLRAGYALRYERNFGNVTFNVIQNPPNYAVVFLQGTPTAPIFPVTLNNAGPFAGNNGTVVLRATSLRAVDPNIVNAYAHQYSASLEHRFGQFTGSATFSGSTGKKLYSIANINRRGSGPAELGSFDTTRTCSPGASSDQLNCQYAAINYRGNQGYSSYQGITFSVESGRFLTNGLTLASHYTYSVSRDNLSSTFSETGVQYNLGFTDAYNPAVDYGYADFDVRHRFVTNFVYEIPSIKYFGSNFARKALGGFQLAGIVNIQSGSPFSINDCGGNSISVCYRLIPNGTVPTNGSVGTGTGNLNTFSYLNLSNQSSVVLPPANPNDLYPGENGFLPLTMTQRNAFRGPGYWNVDLQLSKRFYLTERTFLQLRMDAINAFNHANPALNIGSIDISSTNVVTVSKFGRRQIQFGARFSF